MKWKLKILIKIKEFFSENSELLRKYVSVFN